MSTDTNLAMRLRMLEQLVIDIGNVAVQKAYKWCRAQCSIAPVSVATVAYGAIGDSSVEANR